MKRNKEVEYRRVPREFRTMPSEVEELARCISGQRERLIKRRNQRLNSSDAHNDGGRAYFAKLTDEDAQFPRSKTMRLILKNPNLTVAASAGLLTVILSLVFKRIGFKRLWRWSSTVSPIVIGMLEKKRQDSQSQDAQNQEMHKDEE